MNALDYDMDHMLVFGGLEHYIAGEHPILLGSGLDFRDRHQHQVD